MLLFRLFFIVIRVRLFLYERVIGGIVLLEVSILFGNLMQCGGEDEPRGVIIGYEPDRIQDERFLGGRIRCL